MFTSIELLRASYADQTKVSSVEKHLKKLNPGWQESWFFPTVAIGLSNVVADIHWVHSTESVLLSSTQKSMYEVSSGTKTTAFKLNKLVAGLTHHDLERDKTKKIRASLEAINANLEKELNIPEYNWIHNAFIIGAPKSEVATDPVRSETSVKELDGELADAMNQALQEELDEELDEDKLTQMGVHLSLLTSDQLRTVCESLFEATTKSGKDAEMLWDNKGAAIPPYEVFSITFKS